MHLGADWLSRQAGWYLLLAKPRVPLLIIMLFYSNMSTLLNYQPRFDHIIWFYFLPLTIYFKLPCLLAFLPLKQMCKYASGSIGGMDPSMTEELC